MSPRSRGRRQAEEHSQRGATANAPRRPARLPTPQRAPRDFLGADMARTRIRALSALVSGRSRGATAWARPQALQCARLPLRSEEPDLMDAACLPCLPACVAAVRWWLEYPRPPTMPHCVPTTALIARALRTLPVLLSAERQAHPRSISLKPCLPRRTTTPPRPRRRS